MIWIDIAWVFAVIFVACLAMYALGYRCGRREENRRWRFASCTEDRTMLNESGRDFIVMERGEFWNDWRNPLIRARRGMKS